MVGHPKVHPEYLKSWVGHTMLIIAGGVQNHFSMHMHVLQQPILFASYLSYISNKSHQTYLSSTVRIRSIQIYHTSIYPSL